jgi:hypothetical protein
MIFNRSHLRLFKDKTRYFLKLTLAYIVISIRRKKPVILSFTHDSYIGIEGAIIRFRWNVQNSYKVEISGVGFFADKQECFIKVDASNTTYKLTAFGYKTRLSDTINIKPLQLDRHIRPEVRIRKINPVFDPLQKRERIDHLQTKISIKTPAIKPIRIYLRMPSIQYGIDKIPLS